MFLHINSAEFGKLIDLVARMNVSLDTINAKVDNLEKKLEEHSIRIDELANNKVFTKNLKGKEQIKDENIF